MIIDIGGAAIDRSGYNAGNGYTIVNLENTANASGVLTSFEFYFNTGHPGTSVVVGTFSNIAGNLNDRDYETIGDIFSGSKQTYTGKNCDVVTGDLIGTYQTGGLYESDDSVYAGYYYKAGNFFGQGAASYAFQSGYTHSIYATGVAPDAKTPPVISISNNWMPIMRLKLGRA